MTLKFSSELKKSDTVEGRVISSHLSRLSDVHSDHVRRAFPWKFSKIVFSSDYKSLFFRVIVWECCG